MRATASGVKDETLPVVKHDVSKLKVATRAGKLIMQDCWAGVYAGFSTAINGIWKKKYILLEALFWFIITGGLFYLGNGNLIDQGLAAFLMFVSTIIGIANVSVAVTTDYNTGVLTCGVCIMISHMKHFVLARLVQAEKDLLLSQTGAPEQIAEQKEGRGDESNI